MDLTTIVAFVSFLVLVVAWMAAPNGAKLLVPTVEPSVLGAD